MRKKQINWALIELEYKAGQLSIREIARQYGCSHTAVQRHAQKYGLKRDLTQRVRREVAKRVANLNVKATEDEIVEKYSDRGADVINLHRKDIKALRELETRLIAELNNEPTKLYLAQYQGKVIEKKVGLTASEKSMAANNLANVQHKRIQLERQAFNLDATAGDDNAPDSIRVTFYRKS